MTNVYDYFLAKLGRESEDETLRELDIESPCGRDCVGMIDWTADVLTRATHDWQRDHAIESCDEACQVYWRG